MSYVERILEGVCQKNKGEKEFIQAATEVLNTLKPYIEANKIYEEAGVLERLVEPERQIIFRIPWVDDNNKVQVNRGFRIQFNQALGPYKGGCRFHPSVDLSIMKFLAFEQTLKNSLTALPIGGGKGGADFNPKGKSDGEVMRFCQSFMNELYRHIGPDIDVPAGDIGVGAREVGFLYGQYKRLTGTHVGVFTGKGLSYGGSLARTQATGFGVCYMVEELAKDKKIDLEGRTAVVSGSGNVAIYATEKYKTMGVNVVALSDSNGYIYDKNGIDLDLVKEIKLKQRGRIKQYTDTHKDAVYTEGGSIWDVPCYIASPCATQNELNEDEAKTLIKNGCKIVSEGANMPTTLESIAAFLEAGVYLCPAKAANAGGVATSALEMSQNSQRLSWSFEEVDGKLKNIMANIYKGMKEAAEEQGQPDNFVMGANIAGFKKVSEAMMAQGVI